MQVVNRSDLLHKNHMFRLLQEILSDNNISSFLKFKGGTYATMINHLDRFSVDLDFDLPEIDKREMIRDRLYKIFKKLNLELKDESKNYLQFFLKYDAPVEERNTLKLEINDKPSQFNIYENTNLSELNMVCSGHSLGTMLANKLIAAKARYAKNGKIAGRDFYDLHTFFGNGLEANKAVVEDLSGLKYSEYILNLKEFIQKHVTKNLLYEDLNPLLSKDKMNLIVPVLVPELLRFLDGELENPR